jgi:hypothetical protein
MKNFTLFFSILVLLSACKKDEPTQIDTGPRLIMKFRFDSTQVRLNNIGQNSAIPTNHRAQSPVFNKMTAHYIELAQGDLTPLGQGRILYHADETTAGGSTAIDFSKTLQVGQNEVFFSKALKEIPAGTYKWLRVSLAYQNYDIRFKSGTYHGTGTIGSFIGFNTFINSFMIKNETVAVNANKLQGFWGFETNVPFLGNYTITGQAPAGATTVVNPLQSTSPIPAGSCVVTGNFVNTNGNPVNLQITGNETNDIVIIVSLSTKKSFEWIENSGDEFYEPSAGDMVVDMGVRGMIPIIE